VTPDLRLAPLHDSQNPTVYGSLGISQHLNQGAANTFAGTVALAAGTATVTFPTAYNSAPVCTANDTSAIATVRVQTTATTITLTQSSGTDTIAYICVGNPNERSQSKNLHSGGSRNRHHHRDDQRFGDARS
jgi:hypothetical protein